MAKSTSSPASFARKPSFTRKLRAAERHLAASCPKLESWIEQAGKCDLQPYWDRQPMESLVRAVAHQQLHGRAAEAILGRLLAAFPEQSFPEAMQLTRLKEDKLRAMGFSKSKVETIQGIARAAQEGVVPDRATAESMSDEELIERLVSLKGIGRWTVQMMLIFTLGRLDIMPIDDFGVRAGLGHLYKLKDPPKKPLFAERTDHWAPYRSIGAWYLWRLADSKKADAKNRSEK